MTVIDSKTRDAMEVVLAVNEWLGTPPARLRVPDPEETNAWNVYINHIQAEEKLIETMEKFRAKWWDNK